MEVNRDPPREDSKWTMNPPRHARHAQFWKNLLALLWLISWHFMPGVCSMFEPIRTLLLPGERNHLEGLSPPGPSQSAGPHLHLALPGGQGWQCQLKVMIWLKWNAPQWRSSGHELQHVWTSQQHHQHLCELRRCDNNTKWNSKT
jgi:hypothetical protein